MEQSPHAANFALKTTFIDPIRELIESFRAFRELCDHVIDPDALAMSPPEFLVRPTYDSALQTIAEQKSELFSQITAIFDSVGTFPRGDG